MLVRVVARGVAGVELASGVGRGAGLRDEAARASHAPRGGVVRGMKRSSRKRDRKRPLADPRRAPFVRAVLDRKQREAERAAAMARSESDQSAGLSHISQCLALVEGDDA